MITTMDLVIFEDSIKYDFWIKVVLVATIRSINPASGIIVWWAHSWITSYRSQIEIIRKYRLKIRVSPSRRDQFLEYAHKAFADWKNTHPA